jgi:hypothetical protein
MLLIPNIEPLSSFLSFEKNEKIANISVPLLPPVPLDLGILKSTHLKGRRWEQQKCFSLIFLLQTNHIISVVYIPHYILKFMHFPYTKKVRGELFFKILKMVFILNKDASNFFKRMRHPMSFL